MACGQRYGGTARSHSGEAKMTGGDGEDDDQPAGYRQLRRAGEELLRELDIPPPFTVAAVCAAVQRVRRRPLKVLPLPVPASDGAPYGVWVETAEADFILHEAATSPAHRDQIVMHEIAHILLGHGARTGHDPAAAAVLDRHGYTPAEERHAEVLASLILECADELSPLARPRGLLARIGDALRHPVTSRRG